MAHLSKSFTTKNAAKKALHKVFGVGVYSGNGLHASARFANGSVEKEGDSFAVILISNYWCEASLARAFQDGIDSI